MSRLLRKRGRRTLDKDKLIVRLFVSSLLLFAVLGFGLGLHSAYANEDVEIDPNNIDIPIINKVVHSNADYSLFPPKVITVVTNSSTNKYLVFANTVGDVITAAGINLDENDITIPATEEYVTSDSVIRVVDVDIVTTFKNEVVPFRTVKVNDGSINTGTRVVSQAGVNGNLLKTIKIYYHDGIAVRSELVSQVLTLPAVNQIIKVGTKPFTIQSCSYWDKVIDDYADPIMEKQKNQWMKYIMRCETWCDSGQNTRNVYFGLYQFNQKTYTRYGGTNIWDGTEQIKIVSQMYETTGNRAWHWPSCNQSYLNHYSN